MAGPIGGIAGQADGRMRVEVERMAAAERGLAEQQHAARIVGAGGGFAEPREDIEVVAALAEVRQHDIGEVFLIQRVQDLSRTDHIRLRAGAARRRAQRQVGKTEPRARDLAVIDRGMLCRRLRNACALRRAGRAPRARARIQ